MTREEATKVLGGLLDAFDRDEHGDYFYEHGWEVCEATILAYGALQNQPFWIPVAERLPEYSGRYIVLRKSGDCLDCCYEKDRDSWGVLIDMGEVGAIWVDYNGVTHWMPWPEVEV